MISRRGLLQGILAAGMAPAIVKAGVLMPVRQIWTPPEYMTATEVLRRLDEFWRGKAELAANPPIITSDFIQACSKNLIELMTNGQTVVRLQKPVQALRIGFEMQSMQIYSRSQAGVTR
jgi:hypothetical protein